MAIGRRRFLWGAALIVAVTCPLQTGCDRWALIVNGDGLLLIAVSDDGGGRGGFRVRAREAEGPSRIMDVPTSGTLTLGNFAEGPLELTLLTPAGCRVTPPNPRTVSVNAGEPVNVGFEVHCR